MYKASTYERIPYMDYSSAVNTIIPAKLFTKLEDLGLNTHLCYWILDFLMSRPQVGGIDDCIYTHSEHMRFQPLLYFLFTYN